MSELLNLTAVSTEARDRLVEALRQHKATCPNPNCAEVGNVLAFLAHCLGATRQDLIVMEQLLVRYDLNCQCEFCAPRNAPPKPLTEGKDHAPPIHAQP